MNSIQIEEQMKRAFWDIIDESVSKNDLTLIEKLLIEIIETLNSFIPSRKDIHERIKEDLNKSISWDLQEKLINWIEKFQAPIHDAITKEYRNKIKNDSLKLSEFLKWYYTHLELVHKETWEARHRLVNGESPVPP